MLTLNSVLSGAGTLTKDDTGTLVLGGANGSGFTGNIVVDDGILAFHPAGSTTSTYSGNISGAGQVQCVGGGRKGGGDSAVGDAAEPSGAISLFEAIEKQLGLKLEPQKRTGSVLVIDHIERKPTEN